MMNIEQLAQSLETSIEIIEAIDAISGDELEFHRIWNDPTEAEYLAIWQAVTKNGSLSESNFHWGVQSLQKVNK